MRKCSTHWASLATVATLLCLTAISASALAQPVESTPPVGETTPDAAVSDEAPSAPSGESTGEPASAELETESPRIPLPPQRQLDELWENEAARGDVPPIKDPRQLFEALGVTDSHFRAFTDGNPMGVTDQESLVRVLFRLPDFPLGKVAAWSQSPVDWKAVQQAPDEFRGEILHGAGRVVRVTLERPIEELGERFELDRYYRCDVVLQGNQPAVVYTRQISKHWKLGEPVDYATSFDGFFLKVGGMSQEDRELIFAAKHLAWHPPTMLGGLGMDYSLFDFVRHGKPISGDEGEGFYQMLASMNAAGTNELLRRSEAAPEKSLVELLEEPGAHHGELYEVEGVARRAIAIRVSDPEDAARFGFDHYYEVDVFVDLGRTVRLGDQHFATYPITVCVLQLPAGMPEGPSISEPVRIPAFFFKLRTFSSKFLEEKDLVQPSPLLIGREPKWTVAKDSDQTSYLGIFAAGLFVAALIAMWIIVWWLNRNDRRFHQQTIARNFSVREGESLDELGLETAPETDFRSMS